MKSPFSPLLPIVKSTVHIGDFYLFALLLVFALLRQSFSVYPNFEEKNLHFGLFFCCLLLLLLFLGVFVVLLSVATCLPSFIHCERLLGKSFFSCQSRETDSTVKDLVDMVAVQFSAPIRSDSSMGCQLTYFRYKGFDIFWPNLIFSQLTN